MDHAGDDFGNRINGLAAERLQFFQGCAIVDLSHLAFDTVPYHEDRNLDDKNVARILKIFKIEGCGNLEPENRVAALVDESILSQTLVDSNVTPSQFIQNYMEQIFSRWSHVLDDDTVPYLDAPSVVLLEGLMPHTSQLDRSKIEDLIDSAKIFALLKDSGQRTALKARLLTVPGRIITLNTLFQDAMLFEGPSKALRLLCPQKFKGSFADTMLKQWRKPLDDTPLQASEHRWTTVPNPACSFMFCLVQLWLFAMRHFIYQPEPRGDCSDGFSVRFCLVKMAELAEHLGFESKQTRDLTRHDVWEIIATNILKSFSEQGFAFYTNDQAKRFADQLRRVIDRSPADLELEHDEPDFTTDDEDLEAECKFNLPSRKQFETVRDKLFLKHIFRRNEQSSKYTTPLGVVRDTLFCFLGAGCFDEITIHLFRYGSGEGEYANINKTTEPPQATETPRSESQYSRDQDEHNRHPDTDSDHIMIEDYDLAISNTDMPELSPTIAPDTRTCHMAPGFEDAKWVGPMEAENVIRVSQKFSAIMDTWNKSSRPVIVLYIVDVKRYYKFGISGGESLKSLISTFIQRSGVIMTYGEYGFGVPDLHKITLGMIAKGVHRDSSIILSPGGQYSESDSMAKVTKSTNL
ncbi:hypothetical protein N7539_007704 [Penicillium diatomitis]|uniref:Uncharacterized protein n=1 Tax=Penicillium diatomitis TaxID=2819901 RepID=A0A9W9WUP1_9EURO|nr:uncharacterized protein N7539_007704 [Penicillium diatomitis]KAJ5475417.1 hypothetical protein N7539_007704 [Penicillium diatomitis]